MGFNRAGGRPLRGFPAARGLRALASSPPDQPPASTEGHGGGAGGAGAGAGGVTSPEQLHMLQLAQQIVQRDAAAAPASPRDGDPAAAAPLQEQLDRISEQHKEEQQQQLLLQPSPATALAPAAAAAHWAKVVALCAAASCIMYAGVRAAHPCPSPPHPRPPTGGVIRASAPCAGVSSRAPQQHTVDSPPPRLPPSPPQTDRA